MSAEVLRTRWTLTELDALHAAVGLGAEWLTSDRRREIVEEVTVLGEVVRPDPELECR